jgi:hypothetical protein
MVVWSCCERVKHDVPLFNRPFSQVAEDYAQAEQRRANAGGVSQARAMNIQNKVDGPLNAYFGSTQVHLVSQERWSEYPLWRRENGVGRRNGTINDLIIRIEMSIFAAIMNYLGIMHYVPASHRFEGMTKLKSNQCDEFILEEYCKLHTVGRKWMKEATTPRGLWYRQMCCNFILIICNTGIRLPEAKNLRWREITKAKDKDGVDLLVVYVQGKGNTRKLIATKSVGDYLDRVRAQYKAKAVASVKVKQSVRPPPPQRLARARLRVTQPLCGCPIYSRVRPMTGDRIYAPEQVQRRPDNRDIEGARGRRGDIGCVPQARHQPGNVLQMESQVRRHGCIRSAAASGLGARE